MLHRGQVLEPAGGGILDAQPRRTTTLERTPARDRDRARQLEHLQHDAGQEGARAARIAIGADLQHVAVRPGQHQPADRRAPFREAGLSLELGGWEA